MKKEDIKLGVFGLGILGLIIFAFSIPSDPSRLVATEYCRMAGNYPETYYGYDKMDRVNKTGNALIHCVGDEYAGWYNYPSRIKIYPHENDFKR